MWDVPLTLYQYMLLVYFSGLNLLYGLFCCVGLRASVIIFAREFSQGSLRDLLERDVYKPVSVLVPAYDEEVSIVGSVRSLLALQFPEFEVIVVSDGSTDQTMQRLIDAFALAEQPWATRQDLPTAPIRRTFRSLTHPHLVVVDKENGGKADALNAGLNLARYPLFAAVDADSMLDAEAILRATRLFVEDETLVAVGGTIRPLNAAVVRDGRVTDLVMPKRWLERFQILEYARAFFTGRSGWSHFKSLLIISGAFGLFRRTAVLEAGGFLVGTVSEDMELVVRLHKHFLRERKPYNIRFTPDPICWTEVPADLGTLRRQRNRWHRGLCETLWKHKDMLFNPRYGRLGMVAVPYFWFFEALSPLVEMSGYVIVVIGMLTGFISPRFAILFVLLAVLYGMLLSQLAAGVEVFLSNRYPRMRDRVVIFVAAFFEFLGYRQFLAFERTLATIQVQWKKGQWGKMRRTGVQGPPPGRLVPVDGGGPAGDPAGEPKPKAHV
ncbi:MAG TPA: glycosyltransferase [Actinomycetes bacterium]|nr:glycosyltransferase [Actinomycetes bacterium]